MTTNGVPPSQGQNHVLVQPYNHPSSPIIYNPGVSSGPAHNSGLSVTSNKITVTPNVGQANRAFNCVQMITATGVSAGVGTSPMKALGPTQRGSATGNTISAPNIPGLSVIQPSTRLPVNISATTVYSASPSTMIPLPYKVTTPVQVPPSNLVSNTALASNLTGASPNIPTGGGGGITSGVCFNNQAPVVSVPPPVQTQQPPPSQAHPLSASSLQKLKVEDALTYLDQVKVQFGNTSVYNEFLEIMKQFKSHAIDTPGVIQRVSDLFKGHSRLILGFNAFLPPGYQIRCINNSVHVITPSDVAQPQSGPSNVVPSVTDNISSINSTLNSAKSPVTNPIYYNRPPNAPTGTITSNSTGINRPVPPLIANPPSHNVTQLQNRNQTPIVNRDVNVEGVPEKQSPEFGRAISYVNKIKQRFINDPQTYQEFLDILTNYQKTSESQDSHKSVSSRVCGDKEVYNRVSILFKKDQDLMEEFASFLPEMTGMLAAKKPRAPPLAMSPKVFPKTNFTTQKPANANFHASLQSAQQNPRRRTWSNGSVVNVKEAVPKAVAAGGGNTSKVSAGLVHNSKAHNSAAASANLNSAEVIPSKRARISAAANDIHIKSEATLVNTRSEFAMFDEIRTILQSDASGNFSPQYTEFIKSLSLLNRSIISREEFASMVKPLFLERKHKNSHSLVFKWLLEFLGLNSALYCKTPEIKQDHKGGKNQRGSQMNEGFESHDESIECNGELNESDNSKGMEYCKTEREDVETSSSNGKKISVDCETPESMNFCHPGKSIKEDNDEIQLGIDLLYTYPQHGTSYRIVPPHLLSEQSAPVGLSKSIAGCLNCQYRVVSSISGESSSSSYVGASRKSYSLEYMHRIDDERFEFDMLLETNHSAIKSLDFIQKAIQRASDSELQTFDLRRLSAVNYFNLKSATNRVYGDKSEEILAGIFQYPKSAVPLVRSRLCARQEEWLHNKKVFCKTWNAISSKHALRALDFKGSAFKTTDTKHLRSKSLINDVEKIYREEMYKTEQIPSCIAIDLRKKTADQNIKLPHLVERYVDKMTINDADKLTIYYLKRNCSNRNEKCRIKRLLKHLLKDLRYCDREALSDDEQSANEETSEVEEDSRNNKDVDLDDKGKFLDRSHNLQEILVLGSKDENVDQDQGLLNEGEKERVQGIAKRTFFCTANWYLYFRLHLILCNRLAAIKQTCLEVVEKSSAATQNFSSLEKSSDKNLTNVSAAVELRLKKAARVFHSGEDLYEEVMNAVCDLMDNKIDSEMFEDFIRQQLGLKSFECFTIDRLIHLIARQLQNIVSNDDNVACLKYFLQFYQVKNDENNLCSLMEYQYKFMENLESPANVFRVSFEDELYDNVNVCFRMTSSESDPQFSDFENFKNWTDYVTSNLPIESQHKFFELRSDSGTMEKNMTLQKPVFLPRMVTRGQGSEFMQRRREKNFLVFTNSDDFCNECFNVCAENQNSDQRFEFRKPFCGYRIKRKDSPLKQTHEKWKKIRFCNFTKWLRTKSRAQPTPQSACQSHKDSPGLSENDCWETERRDINFVKENNERCSIKTSVNLDAVSCPVTDKADSQKGQFSDRLKLNVQPKSLKITASVNCKENSAQLNKPLLPKNSPLEDDERCNPSLESGSNEGIE